MTTKPPMKASTMSESKSPQQKAWLVESHEPDGEVLGPEYAVLKLDQPFIDAIATQAAILEEQWRALREAIFASATDDFELPETAEVRMKFRAPAQYVLFEGEDAPNKGLWEIWRGNCEAVISFISFDGHVTTGIPVAELVARFTAQQPDAVEVFTRDESIESFTEMVEEILDGQRTFHKVLESTREVLEKALPVCESLLDASDAEIARAHAQRAGGSEG